MQENFERCHEYVLVHEGGFVNHPKDPGGATNMGITQRVYDADRARRGQPQQSVRLITNDEVRSIYKRQYWNAVRGDDLPWGVDYAVYDFAVNSGPSRAVKFLQEVVGVAQDGIIGEITLAAVQQMDAFTIIRKLCENRMAWLHRLKTFSTFGRGWTRRVMGGRTGAQDGDTGVIDRAREMSLGNPTSAPTGPASGKADAKDEKLSATVLDALKDKTVLGQGAATLGGLGAILSGDGPVQYAIAAALVIGVLAFSVWMLRSQRVAA